MQLRHAWQLAQDMHWLLYGYVIPLEPTIDVESRAAQLSCQLTLAALPCLQTKDGKGVAKGETAEEFEDMMALVSRQVEALQALHPKWAEEGAIYSWDNAAFHTRAHLPALDDRRLVIPPRSPDIHKVIEHTFHPVKSGFRHAFGHRRKVKSVKQAMRLLQQVVGEVVDAESVSRDCLTVKQTLLSIIKNGGAWADPGLR